MISEEHLLEHLGKTDVYLLDQFMKRRFRRGGRVLDVGCGSGRNLDLFLRGDYEVWALDPRYESVGATRERAARMGRPIPEERVFVGPVEHAPFRMESFDTVLAVAVLHFAHDPGRFREMLDACWRLVAPGGVLFTRLATRIGIEDAVEDLGDGWFRSPDGREWLLSSAEDLAHHTERLGAQLVEPVKTVNVGGERCMSNWILAKPG